MRKKHLVIYVIALIVLIGLNGCTEPPEPGRYSSPGNLFSMKLPQGWQGRRTVGAMLTLENPDRKAVIKIMVLRFPQDKTLKEYIQEAERDDLYGKGIIEARGKAEIDEVKGFWEIKRDQQMIEGKVTYVKTLNYYLEKEGWIYIINFSADEETLTNCMPVVKDCVQSFRFKK
ncbi:MAG: hypothetical protein ABII88_09160 [Candidatus Omnitrophota bacterium]